VLARGRAKEACPSVAQELLDIVAEGTGRSARARVGLINRIPRVEPELVPERLVVIRVNGASVSSIGRAAYCFISRLTEVLMATVRVSLI
jgi:hypothetical protein